MNNVKRVVALGFFDGVHLGHQALMKKTAERAAEYGAVPSVISFDLHPDTLVHGTAIPLLSSVPDRKELIRRVGGIEDIIIIHFDRAFMHTAWTDFLQTMRLDMGAVHLVMGSDFCCGYKGEGTSEKISGWCRENGLGSDIVEKVMIDDIVVSSSYIRELISDGDMEKAARYLGHPHSLTDIVGSGYKIGRKIGAPTINTSIPSGVIVPRYGVYASRVWFDNGPRNSVTNVGVRPTFGENNHLTVETNVLDYSGDLYGEQVRLEFLKFIREERSFPDPEELGIQIQHDIKTTKAFFEGL